MFSLGEPSMVQSAPLAAREGIQSFSFPSNHQLFSMACCPQPVLHWPVCLKCVNLCQHVSVLCCDQTQHYHLPNDIWGIFLNGQMHKRSLGVKMFYQCYQCFTIVKLVLSKITREYPRLGILVCSQAHLKLGSRCLSYFAKFFDNITKFIKSLNLSATSLSMLPSL